MYSIGLHKIFTLYTYRMLCIHPWRLVSCRISNESVPHRRNMFFTFFYLKAYLQMTNNFPSVFSLKSYMKLTKMMLREINWSRALLIQKFSIKRLLDFIAWFCLSLINRRKMCLVCTTKGTVSWFMYLKNINAFYLLFWTYSLYGTCALQHHIDWVRWFSQILNFRYVLAAAAAMSTEQCPASFNGTGNDLV